MAQIITFGTMAAKAAIKDVGRVLDMPYAEVDRIAKMIPGTLGMTIDKAMAEFRRSCRGLRRTSRRSTSWSTRRKSWKEWCATPECMPPAW